MRIPEKSTASFLSALLLAGTLAGCAALGVQGQDTPAPEADNKNGSTVKKPQKRPAAKRSSRKRRVAKRKPVKQAPPQPAPLPKIIEAEELRIVDKSGKVRASFRVDDAGISGLRIYDHEGRARAVLLVLEDGTPHLLFLDENGNTPTQLHSLP